MTTAQSRIVTTLVAATAQFGGAAVDLVALADVKDELDIDDVASDVWLRKVITRLSAAAQKFCNRSLIAQTYVETVWPFEDSYAWQVPSHLAPLQLKYWPLAATPSTAATAPPLSASLAAASGGALAARSYSVRLTYVTPAGETAGGAPAALALAANTLASVRAPGPDRAKLATGYNVYAGGPGAETKQNATPIAVNASWTEPTSGLIAGAALPNAMLVVEASASLLGPTPLAEGVDFAADARLGQLTRLRADGRAREWGQGPILVLYPAGFTAATVPPDLQDGILQLIKARYFARQRDPLIKSENVQGDYSVSYLSGPDDGLPGSVQATLDRYRDRVMA